MIVDAPALVKKKSTTTSEFSVNAPPLGLRTRNGWPFPKYGCRSPAPVGVAVGSINGVTAVGNGVAVAVGCRSSVSETVYADITPIGSVPNSTVGTGVAVGVGVLVGLGTAVDVGGTVVAVGTGVGGTAVGVAVGSGVDVGGAGTRVAVAGTDVGSGVSVGTATGAAVGD